VSPWGAAVIFFDHASRLVGFLAEKFGNLFFALGSNFSLASLASALFIAVTFLLVRRGARRREVTVKLMTTALFPKWLYRNPSFKADIGLLVFTIALWTTLFGWAVLSIAFVGEGMRSVLTATFGTFPNMGLSHFWSSLIATICTFVAYELGYWTDHYLSHRVPFLWEFHKVHHTAEVLTPITVYRVHPIDTVVYHNILALFLGISTGGLSYVLGQQTGIFEIGGTNLILFGFTYVTVHLQHSHVWIAATGPLGRLFMSPAHHQIHHSSDPRHFNKNFGSCLALWDWALGTLYMPGRTRERLQFGLDPAQAEHHSLLRILTMPFFEAPRRLGVAWLTPPVGSRRFSMKSDAELERAFGGAITRPNQARTE
jgi:sterol desaturase/sphingolipid hydroxylase (fatty acid hydroxylase superfamily)